MRIGVTGSTGMLGGALVQALRDEEHEVVRFVRKSRDLAADERPWQPGEGRLDPSHLSGVDAVVHLSGETLAQRWTDAARARIRESRIRSTELLSHAMAMAEPRPGTLVTASGIGAYGDRGDELLDEESSRGADFVANLVRDWEGATAAASQAGIRVAHVRMGVLLSRRGGMIERLLPIFKLGAGGKIGSGNQWLSWIALDDAVRAIQFVLANESLRGPVNVTSPNPVSNAEFTRRFGQALGRPTIATVPAFALKLVYGEMADATILASQRGVPAKLQRAGFDFRYPELTEALRRAVE